ncbi:MAG: sensor histidine kinase [Candidatus Limnocylindrales bacterium]
MEAARAGTNALGSRFEGLHAEATEAVGYSANTLRAVRERYREAYAESLARWQVLRDDLEAADRGPRDTRPRLVDAGATEDQATDAAEAGAADARLRTLRAEVESLGGALGAHQSTLAKLEFAELALERMWLFLGQGDGSLVAEGDGPTSGDDVAMRIIEAQEAERSRLAQDIHDGPAQALTNAIFQADFIERIGATDPPAAAAELRTLRDLLRRELTNVRDSINQLRPPTLDETGLEGAIDDAIERLRALTSLTITADFSAPATALDDHQRTVALRVTQEALQNVRKHASAATVVVRTELADDDWTLEIRDDGRGFDVGAVAARGRRNFGLQFMRERAELIGGRFDVRSRPDGGTVVRLSIPTGARTGIEESR